MHGITLGIIAILSLSVASTASATTGDTAGFSPQDSSLPLSSPASDKTLAKAWTRAALHTTIPIGLGLASTVAGFGIAGVPAILYGIYVGPSMGNFYLRDMSGGTSGIAWRLGGSGVATVGFVIALGCALSNWGTDQPSNCPEILPVGLIAAGGLMALGGTVWHLHRLPATVEKHKSANSRSKAAISIAPVWAPARNAVGLRLAAHF